MKILVLMDSFKGSLTSMEAGQAVKEGIAVADRQAEITVYPFADGGEGTLDAFFAADKNSRKQTLTISDPLGRRIDSQTAMGKAPARIAAAAKKYHKPVIAICGCVGEGAEKCHDIGIDAIFPIVSGAMTPEEAMKKETASANLRRTAEEVIYVSTIKYYEDNIG